jgi:nitrite reductase/ring-hydroxylating ferredoxin subunit
MSTAMRFVRPVVLWMMMMITLSMTAVVVEAFQPIVWRTTKISSAAQQPQQHPKRTRLSFVPHMVRRGKGSIGKEVGNNNNKNSNDGGMGMGGDSTTSSMSSSANSNINWTPIAVSVQALPKEENKVTLIDTNLVTMKNAQTNPTGAVSVIQYQKQMYCFAVNCPSCQIPLTKAKCVSSHPKSTSSSSTTTTPLLQCDLCKATYNIKTGEKITDTEGIGESPGFFGGIVKSIFSSKASGPLKVYQLAEKNGKLLIAGLD